MFALLCLFWCLSTSATCIKGHRSTTCNHGYVNAYRPPLYAFGPVSLRPLSPRSHPQPSFYIGIISERPLHEIKKKGRPSTQCPHCKELRKAKQVHVRCICGREEGKQRRSPPSAFLSDTLRFRSCLTLPSPLLSPLGSAAVVNGLKRAKSLSHDGRLPVTNAIGGEDILRSLSSQGQSPQDSLDVRSSTGGRQSILCSLSPALTLCRSSPEGCNRLMSAAGK